MFHKDSYRTCGDMVCFAIDHPMILRGVSYVYRPMFIPDKSRTTLDISGGSYPDSLVSLPDICPGEPNLRRAAHEPLLIRGMIYGVSPYDHTPKYRRRTPDISGGTYPESSYFTMDYSQENNVTHPVISLRKNDLRGSGQFQCI